MNDGQDKNDIPALLDDRSTTIAVVGATDDPGKYGGIVYRRMKALGYRVWAVNPGRASVNGDPAYPDLASLPESPDIVDFVVPPEVGRRVAEQALGLGFANLWFQPGAEWRGAAAELEPRGASVVVDACIMVRAAWSTGRDGEEDGRS